MYTAPKARVHTPQTTGTTRGSATGSGAADTEHVYGDGAAEAEATARGRLTQRDANGCATRAVTLRKRPR